MLHVVVKHVTHDPRNHYIRKMAVYNNDDKEPIIYRYVQQSSAQAQIEDIAIDLKPGDTIKVEAVCVEREKAESTFVVPQPDPSKDIPNQK